MKLLPVLVFLIKLLARTVFKILYKFFFMRNFKKLQKLSKLGRAKKEKMYIIRRFSVTILCNLTVLLGNFSKPAV